MRTEPQTQYDYGSRQVEAARRVLVDLGQVLASYFKDSIVVVGGWVPNLQLPNAEEAHVGSIDVDLALDASKLYEGRYARIVEAMVATGRYERADEAFKMRATVDMKDGAPSVVVDIDFLKPPDTVRKRKGPKLLEGFRPLDADGCAAAFVHPARVDIPGHMISGAENSVDVLVASVEDFLVMKAYALAGRDKPKDAYDICFCLENSPAGIEALAREWRHRRDDRLVSGAIEKLQEKFAAVTSYGPSQVVAFYASPSREEREMQARRAFELVQAFLSAVFG